MTAAPLAALARIVGADYVHAGDDARPYLTEWRGAITPRAAAVVRPACTAAVAEVVAACAAAGCAVVAQSGNTGLVGGAAASDSSAHVVLNLERMAAIRALDTKDATLTVEAGATLADAKRRAAAAGLYLALDLAARERCRIGGNLASNAGGLNVLRYGNARAQTLGLEVVLADGRVWHGLGGLRKDNSGLDLRDLFIGSEGALGVITAATLKLAQPERQRATALCGAARVEALAAFARELIRRSGENVVACELMAAQAVALAGRHGGAGPPPFAAEYEWYLLIELASSADGDWLAPILRAGLADARARGALGAVRVAQTAGEAAAFWALREAIPAAQTAEGASLKHDVSVAPARMPEFLARALPAVRRALPGVRPCPFGHLGDGNLHFNLTRPVDGDDAAFRAQGDRTHAVVYEIVAEMGGSIAAEHGIGRVKTAALARYKSPLEREMMQSIKKALDPHQRLNPGALIPPAADDPR